MSYKKVIGLLIAIIFFISVVLGILIFKYFNKDEKIGYEYIEKTFNERTNSIENSDDIENEVLNANSNSDSYYIIKNLNGYIVVYEIDENNNEELIESTGIAVEYLTETDKVNLDGGIKVFGKENLNKVLEDFE